MNIHVLFCLLSSLFACSQAWMVPGGRALLPTRTSRSLQTSAFVKYSGESRLGFSSPKSGRYDMFLFSTPQLIVKKDDKKDDKKDVRTSGRTRGRGKADAEEETDVEEMSEQDLKKSLRDDIEQNWRLIMHDDEVHELDAVPEMIAEACPLCTEDRARDVTMEVHNNGLATVVVACKKLIEEYSANMQNMGLTVSIAPDNDYVGADGDGDVFAPQE